MKKTVAFFAGSLLLASLFVSCGSTNNIDSAEEDYYGEEPEATAIPIKTQKSSSKKQNLDPYSRDKVRGKNEGVMEKLFDFKKFDKYDSTSVIIKKNKKRACVFVHKPQTDLGGFLVRYDTSIYACFLASAQRNVLIKAAEQYLSDFENKKLDKKLKKSEQVYGEVGGYEEFGISDTMMTSYSKPKVRFGYKFIGKSPYFCIFVRRSPNLNTDLGSSRPPESIDQKYFFTRAQLEKLTDFLSDENIDALNIPFPEESAEPDSYEEEPQDTYEEVSE